MSEATPINVQAFQPFQGGTGIRINVSTISARAQVPGTQAVSNPERLRILITNPNTFSVSVLMGQNDAVATLNCLELMSGTQALFTPPTVAPDAVWVAVICESGSGHIQVTAGYGT